MDKGSAFVWLVLVPLICGSWVWFLVSILPDWVFQN